jgi:hypothetical protein
LGFYGGSAQTAATLVSCPAGGGAGGGGGAGPGGSAGRGGSGG